MLLLFQMYLLGYLASSVTVVTSSHKAGSSVGGGGFEGRAAAQQGGRRRDLGDVSFRCSGCIYVLFFLISPECCFKMKIIIKAS